MYFDKNLNRVVEPRLHPNPDLDYNEAILDSEQVKAIQLVVENMEKQNTELKESVHKHLFIESCDSDDKCQNTQGSLPRVYIAEYTTHDDYGPLRETDVFSKEIDAWAFVLKQREEGATDISVKPRLVYLDKDRTVDIDE
ncbi:hypothetical protein LMC05_06040 [Limosilactobacillus reuteri]|uniref:hypothetical protein n=1 Tax=Limosilactobacillus reuteri TaxID=1598 RepID=UPI001E53B257|nr:hypothetical protein [Limosilactobacillus reuteri]MCC4508564.1 hypothetical protein [Limosilactobacillus reuteri]